MNQTLVRRGPDEGGQFLEPGVGLAMRRLSIIDLAGGHQPIQNEDGTLWIVFNGEIYNYRELRTSLIQRGHRFRTDSDTEVIIHLYEEYGDDLVHKLRGMFAFAIWDGKKRRGLLARDRLGIKPLFYAQTGGALVFGSEIKAILASGLVDRSLDLQALDAFFAYTYIPAPLTIYRSVRKLEPGHLLTFEAGSVSMRRYWDLRFTGEDRSAGDNDWDLITEGAIRDAVTSHLVSDVPIGAFLSGGIDSSMVVALMSTQASAVETFTMGFGGQRSPLIDERPLAKAVADKYSCRYHEFTVEPDFRDIVGELVGAFDEPFADDSVIPSYYLSKLTRQSVKVALSGLGGDELFAGYDRYAGMLMGEYYERLVPAPVHRNFVLPLVKRLPEPAHGTNRIDHAKRFASSVLQSPAERYLGFVSTLSAAERPKLFATDVRQRIDFGATGQLITQPFERCDAPDNVSRALYADMMTYLPEDILALSDRSSMWHSLEVRVPLVDHPLVELSARMPLRHKLRLHRKKVLLRKIAARHLPPAILAHRKQGFESPMASWLRGELAGYAREVLNPRRLSRSGFFDGKYVSAKLEEHMSGVQRNNKLLFSLIMFQEWHERQGG